MNGPNTTGVSSNAVLLMDTYIHGVGIQDKGPKCNKYRIPVFDYVRSHTHLKTPEEISVRVDADIRLGSASLVGTVVLV